MPAVHYARSPYHRRRGACLPGDNCNVLSGAARARVFALCGVQKGNRVCVCAVRAERLGCAFIVLMFRQPYIIYYICFIIFHTQSQFQANEAGGGDRALRIYRTACEFACVCYLHCTPTLTHTVLARAQHTLTHTHAHLRDTPFTHQLHARKRQIVCLCVLSPGSCGNIMHIHTLGGWCAEKNIEYIILNIV